MNDHTSAAAEIAAINFVRTYLAATYNNLPRSVRLEAHGW